MKPNKPICPICKDSGYVIEKRKLPNGSPNPVAKKCLCSVKEEIKDKPDMPYSSCPK